MTQLFFGPGVDAINSISPDNPEEHLGCKKDDPVLEMDLPLKGMFRLLDKLLSLVVAPLFVGLVLTLVDHWLDD